MIRYLIWLSFLFLSPISALETEQIASLIWENECAKTLTGLTSWNKGEEFASLGIGHFIWYPKNQKKTFEETFPSLLSYLKKNHVSLPKWLDEYSACPWNSREEFYAEKNAPQREELQNLLYQTRSLQTEFIINQLDLSLPKMLVDLSTKEQATFVDNYMFLKQTSEGLFALIDYHNFKGAGTNPNERYKGAGWGLKQVLLEMETSSLESFIASANQLLEKRVRNSPPERNESRWLLGWKNRLNKYKNPLY